MHFYQHHLGDYAKDTGHLSMTEHGAYRMLMDHYYSTEMALPADFTSLCRIARASSRIERAAVQRVSSEFFVLSNGVLKHKRIEIEISEYRRVKQRNSENGRCGGRPKRNPLETHSVTSGLILGNPNETEAMIHKPVTNPSPKGEENARAKPAKPKVDPDAVSRLYNAYPRKVAKPDAIKAITEALETTPEKQIMDALTAWKTVWRQDETELRFIPHPGRWFRRKEWENEGPQPIIPEGQNYVLGNDPNVARELEEREAKSEAWREEIRQDKERAAELELLSE